MGDLFQQLRSALADRYRLERELGSGGTATVYLAHDLHHGRRVAIKVLHPELAGAVGHDRFLREIRIASDLSHPHILPLLDSGSAVAGNSSLPFYVMPFVEGESLRARLHREQQLPIEEAVKIAHDVAAALSYAHRRGVVHRDIKPENILLAGDEAVVADFGIARAIDRAVESEVITSAGLAVGTPAYMSPEQGAGQHEVDGRSDIYSLGCVLYEMLGGDPPFSGPSPNAIAARHRVDAVPPLRTIRPSVPPSLEAVVLRSLEKVPADRFKTAEHLAAALGQQHTPSAQTPPGLLAGPDLPALSPRTRETPIPRWRGARQALRIALGSALIIAVLLLTWRVISEAHRRSSRPRYSVTPVWSAWRGWTGEFFPLFAFTDSMLVVRALGSEVPQAFDGERWTPLVVSDSFDLLRYVGPIADGRLLATKSVSDSSGQPHLQYWWMIRSSGRLDPLAQVGGSLPDDEVRPHWWSDGRDAILWQDAIRRSEASGWVREPTGTTGDFADLWGPDLRHRFAIPSSGDSLLVFDGISWRSADIPVSRESGNPVYRAGASFGDGATIVLGDECAGEQRCRPLLLQQDRFGAFWHRVSIPPSIGIPLAFPADTANSCATSQLSLNDVAGRSREDYFIWGSWNSCDPVEEGGCPTGQPCFWHIRDNNLQPVEDLRGKIVQAVGFMRGSAYALLDDGTLWREVGDHWRAVTQVPGLPTRMIGASSRLVVRLTGRDLSYEPGQKAQETPFVRHMDSIPQTVSEGKHPLRLLVRDTTAALLTSNGEVFVSRCRMDRVAPLGTGAPQETLRCAPWHQLPASQESIRDIEILSSGQVIGVGSRGVVVSWFDGIATVESLPRSAQGQSLWAIAVTTEDRALAIGPTMVVERDSSGRWSVVRHIPISKNPNRFMVLPEGDLVVVERSIQIWDRSADSIPVAILYRLGGVRSAAVGALHALSDGRLIAGLANPDEPLVGGRLMVWAAPARANRSQPFELPISVDISDLADDGRYLYVVGRGGSLRIPLDSLPFRAPVN